MWRIIIAVIMRATMWTKHVAEKKTRVSVSTDRPTARNGRKHTWLENQCPSNVYIPAVALWLNPLICAHQRTDDESGLLAYCVE
jgi:hypothetical protein